MYTIPKPNGQLTLGNREWKIRPQLRVAKGVFESWCLNAFAKRANVKWIFSAKDSNIILLNLSSFEPEEYEIEVTLERVIIKASTEAGVVLALTTLYTRLNKGRVTCFTLREAPKYSHRGLMLDCVRHFFPAEAVKKVIEQCALVKINILHWGLTNDQGWRMESKAYPELHEGIPFYTQEEIRELVGYAKERNVTIIPEIDMPGHMASAVHVLPWLSCAGQRVKRAVGGGIYKAILCAGQERTYEFVDAILEELTELFDSPFIHIGGDEAPKVEWKACPHCTAKLKEIGGESFEDLQGYFTRRVSEMLKAKGRKPICWNETLKSQLRPENLTIQYWMQGITDKQAGQFLRDGNPMILSDMFRLYLDYPHAVTSLRRVYDYIPSIGGQPCGDAPNVAGLEACLWTERVETVEQMERQLFPRVIALAEAAWSCERDYEDFTHRLELWMDRLQDAGIHATPLAEASSASESRMQALRETLGSFSGNAEPDSNRIDPAVMFGGGDGEAVDFGKLFAIGFGD